jgi:hypothetical protein
MPSGELRRVVLVDPMIWAQLFIPCCMTVSFAPRSKIPVRSPGQPGFSFLLLTPNRAPLGTQVHALTHTLMQHSGNSAASQVKLDEIIRADEAASTFIGIEHLRPRAGNKPVRASCAGPAIAKQRARLPAAGSRNRKAALYALCRRECLISTNGVARVSQSEFDDYPRLSFLKSAGSSNKGTASKNPEHQLATGTPMRG